MTKSVGARVEALEQRNALGPGSVAFVGSGHPDWTEEQLEQAAAEKQRRVGPHAAVIMIQYEKEADGWYLTASRYQAEGVEARGLVSVPLVVAAFREAEKAVKDG